jgi:hypothetical protein
MTFSEKRGKLITISLIILIIIPIVNAMASNADPLTIVYGLKFNESQSKKAISDGLYLTSKNISSSDYENTLPTGSVIYQQNGITRVFDSNGVQNSIIDDNKSEKVITPMGLIPASHMFIVPNGALVKKIMRQFKWSQEII